MGDTTIQWTNKTWNTVTGCRAISAGCKNCWAKKLHEMRHTAYLNGHQMPEQYAVPFEQVLTHPERLQEPLRWRSPQKVAVVLGGDLFHEDVPDTFIVSVFAVMARAKQHTFQVLTKRAERMLNLVGFYRASGPPPFSQRVVRAAGVDELPWPLPNVWLGVSVEDQRAADERIPLLLQTPAAVRWISAEPLLGPLELWPAYHALGTRRPLDVLDWVVVGGESGPKARPCNVEWIRSIVQQCQAASVPCFVKQLGANRACYEFYCIDPDHLCGLEKINDRKGGDPSEWPEDLRVRQYPEVPRVG